MGGHDVTHDEIRDLLLEQSKTLVNAMVVTNEPLERRLNKINAHLADLNGKVYAHALALSKGGERMDGLRMDINELKEDRRHLIRRVDDRGVVVMQDSGENRRITMRDVYIVVSTVLALWGLLKILGLLR